MEGMPIFKEEIVSADQLRRIMYLCAKGIDALLQC